MACARGFLISSWNWVVPATHLFPAGRSHPHPGVGVAQHPDERLGEGGGVQWHYFPGPGLLDLREMTGVGNHRGYATGEGLQDGNAQPLLSTRKAEAARPGKG